MGYRHFLLAKELVLLILKAIQGSSSPLKVVGTGFAHTALSASNFNGEVTGSMNKGVRTLPPLDCGGTGRTPFFGF
jgi:BioD-like phosphotransacetylase family protein